MRTIRFILVCLFLSHFVNDGFSQSISWGSDNNTAISWGASGTGDESIGQGGTSPSGLWDVYFGFNYYPHGSIYVLTVDGAGFTYLPTGQSAESSSYGTYFPTNSTEFVAQVSQLEGSLVQFANWNGGGNLFIYPPTDQNPSGSWSFGVGASGSALPVPEPSPLLLVVIGMLALVFAHRVAFSGATSKQCNICHPASLAPRRVLDRAGGLPPSDS